MTKLPLNKRDRRIWALAAPIMLSNTTVPLLGLVDTGVMGHLPGPEYLGAVGLGTTVFNFIFWGFGFLRMGTTGLVAQAYGRGDREGLRALLLQAGALGLILALSLLLLSPLIEWLMLYLLDGSEQVLALLGQYFRIRIWAAPATLMSYVLIGWFVGMQNTRATLAVMVLANSVNIALDLLFVVGLDWKIEGVAAASVVAQYAGVALGLLLTRGLLRRAHALGGWPWQALVDWPAIRKLLAVNGDIMIRTLSLLFAFAFFSRQSAVLGDDVLAANTVLLNFIMLMAFALDAFAHAAEALVGRMLGAEDRDGLRWTFWRTGVWSALFAAVFALAYALAGGLLIDTLTSIASVRELARVYLPWLVIAPLLSVWSYWLDGVYIGATRSRDMRNTMLLSLAIFLGLWWLSLPLANHGLWLAFMAFMLARAASMGWVLWWRPLLR